ncbi:hypothetical protein MLD38_027066 [Melastoma candidum]|uniref:Uncharacterized protein n=1 Tax=Melastoma candidum TaxID=119954 RepID=A0ACB9P3P3_9MYRT|nr:hypothetical protein MLD38_027066 [Melastoma candidum]
MATSIAVNESATNSSLDRNPSTQLSMQNLVDLFTNLNPSAKEFFPSRPHLHLPYFSISHSFPRNAGGFILAEFPLPDDNFCPDLFPAYARAMRKGEFSQGRRRSNGKAYRAQREDNIRRTVYISDIDQLVTEELLANMFSICGQVLDCRICGDPHSVLRFAFVEFADEYGARAALSLGGMMLGYYPVRVLPSKTAILPVNPSYLPRSEDEREMCARTVYCTNIDKMVSQADVKSFFEKACGTVTRLRLLGDHVHSTRIAFVEFAVAESAIAALSCSGMVLGTQPIRVSPSKTPVRPRVSRPSGS